MSPALATAMTLFLALICCLAVAWVIRSAPPRTITLTSGPDGSSFQRWAQAYQKALATHGVTLEILPSGRVSGRVATASLVIQEGAIYEGELRMSNLDEEPSSLETQTMARPANNGAETHDEVPAGDQDPKGGY